MARVHANSEPRVPVQRVAERGELRNRAADGAARTRGVLEAEPEIVGRELEELAKCRGDGFHRVVESVAEVRADVEDDGVGADRRAVSIVAESASNDFERTSRSRLARFTR